MRPANRVRAGARSPVFTFTGHRFLGSGAHQALASPDPAIFPLLGTT